MNGLSLASLRQYALFWAVVLYALVDVIVDELLKTGDSVSGRLIQVLVSSLSLLALLAVGQALALRLWGRRLLRTWVYNSSSGNYGIATFTVVAGNVHYRVDLYPDAVAVLAALDRRPGYGTACLGHARSQAVTYKDDRVDLIYQVENSSRSYAAREGVLSLEMIDEGRGMKGYWRSSSETGEARRGELDFVTVGDFRALQAST